MNPATLDQVPEDLKGYMVEFYVLNTEMDQQNARDSHDNANPPGHHQVQTRARK